MGVYCNECYKKLSKREESVYPLTWKFSGDMYCTKHETRPQFKLKPKRPKKSST